MRTSDVVKKAKNKNVLTGYAHPKEFFGVKLHHAVLTNISV